MNKSKLILRYKRQLASFRTYFERSAVQQSVEDIHRLRVAVKKIKALLRLMEAASGHHFSKKEHYELFASVFQSAGELREAQVNLILTAKLDNPLLLHYIKHLEKNEEQASKKLLADMRGFNLEKLEHLDRSLIQNMEKIPDRLIAQDAVVHLLAKLKKAKKLQKRSGNSDTLHKIRVHLKSANEILSLLHELHPSRGPGEPEQAVKELNRTMGKWHDRTILIDSLKDFISHNSPEKNIKSLKKLVRKIERKNEKTRKKTNKLLRKYLTRHLLEPIKRQVPLN